MNYKNKILSVCTGLYIFVSLQAQQAVISAGGSGKSGNLSINWSIGEVITETFVSMPFKLTQGVQQPHIKVEPVAGMSEMKIYQITAYPNPANDVVIVSIAESAENQLTLKVFDINGRLVHIAPITGNETRIHVKNFAAGIYLMQIMDKNNNVQTFKIIKQ